MFPGNMGPCACKALLSRRVTSISLPTETVNYCPNTREPQTAGQTFRPDTVNSDGAEILNVFIQAGSLEAQRRHRGEDVVWDAALFQSTSDS